MNEYEQYALEEINRWKNPPRTKLDDLMEVVAKPFDKMGGIILDNKAGEAVTKAIHGIISLINDGTSWTVRDEAIFEEFRNEGHSYVRCHQDVHQLDLLKVDKTLGYLGVKYKLIAASEGVATGILGAPGIVADIPLIFGIVLRAIGEYATYYGFDLDNQAERAYALHILMAATSPSLAAKQAALAELARIAAAVARKKAWVEIEKFLSAGAIKKIGQALGYRITKGKLGQIVPVVGGLVGGGYNAYFASCACETAFYLYRERFIARKYGLDVA